MFAVLKTKAADYFSSKSPLIDIYEKTKTNKQRRNFYILLLAHHIAEPLKIIDLITTLIDKKTFQQDNFLSVIWGISLQLSNQTHEINQLAELLTLIISKSLVPKHKLLENLPQDLIHKSNLMEQQQIDKKYGRTYTKTYFEQNKFSLMKENNEGFSKLLILLTNISDNLQCEEVWNKVLSLVGKFDLDPDRVLDLIIETQLLNPAKNIYTSLIRKFKGQSITTILSNRLAKIPQKKSKSLVFAGYFENFSKTTIEEIYKKHGEIPNPSLIKLIAELIASEIIQPDDVTKFLEPSNVSLEEINYRRIKQGQERVMKAFKISLEQLDQNQKKTIFNEDNLKFFGQLLYSTKLALYTEFVKMNQWELFERLWAPYRANFDLMLYQPLLNEILNLIEWSIEPIYERISFGRFVKNVVKTQKFQEKERGIKKSHQLDLNFFQQLRNLLTYVKDYVGLNHSLTVKLCRIFKALKKGTLKIKDGQDEQACNNIIKELLKNYIVPGVNYQQTNPAIGNEAFTLLELYPYQFRYECYLEIYKNKMNHNPYMAKAFELYKNKQNIIVNNLSNNNKKQFGKRLAKLTHNHALQVMYWIVRRLLKEDYQAIIPEIISALNNSTPFTLEQTMFLMIFYLNENHQPAVKLKSAQFQPWFKNITTFIALFYRRYLEVDLQPVFDFFIMKTSQEVRDLEDNEEMPGAYIKLLHELLNKMLGSFIIEDVNKAKYQILSAGPKLQIELLYLTSEIRAAKKSKHTLEEFFWDKTSSHFEDNTLAFNLLVLLCQKRAEFMHKTYIANLKIVGDTYDDYTTLIVQLVRVLTYQATDFTRYAELLPQNPLDVMINHYKIPIEIGFEIIRPAVKHISKMNQQQWTGLTTQVQLAISNYVLNKSYFNMGYSPQNVCELLIKSRTNIAELLPTSMFTAFWFLTLDSIYFPDKLYNEKTQDLRKKIDPLLKKNDKIDKNDRETQKNKTLYEKLKKEEEIQKQKYTSTLTAQNLKKLQIPYFKTSKDGNILISFAEAFVQFCLLPRLLLDPRQAIYCMKFTIVLIKANKMSSSKSIKMLTYIIEFVMNYLPFSTKRQAQNCLATFLSQILGIFINWNDQAKLKQDMKFYLDIEDLKDNYPKLRQFLLRLFERVGNLIKSIVEEPYVIKNCLYMLEKVDAIPGYREQAEELENHMKQLRQIHSSVDMKTILDMQIAILGSKKAKLSGKPEDRNSITSQNTTQSTKVIEIVKSTETLNTKPQVYIALQKERQRRDQRDRLSKDRDRISKERQKSFQKDSKDRQKQKIKQRDSKDRANKQSKDRFGKQAQKQLKNYDQKGKFMQERDKRQQREDKKDSNSNREKGPSLDKQRINNYKPQKKPDQLPKVVEKRIIKGQQKTFSKHPIHTDGPSQRIHTDGPSQRIHTDGPSLRQSKYPGPERPNYERSNVPSSRTSGKEMQIETIKPSTMTVKQMRERQAIVDQSNASSDANLSRNNQPTPTPQTGIIKISSKSQTLTQSKQTEMENDSQNSKVSETKQSVKNNKSTLPSILSNKEETAKQVQKKQDFSKQEAKKEPQQTQKKLNKINQSSQKPFSETSIQAADKKENTTSQKENNQTVAPNVKDSPKKEEIRIGPKRQITERMQQSNSKKNSSGTPMEIQPNSESKILLDKASKTLDLPQKQSHRHQAQNKREENSALKKEDKDRNRDNIKDKSPIKDNKDKSPTKQVKSKSPAKQYKGKSPIKQYKAKSPAKQIKSKSPVMQVKAKSPAKDFQNRDRRQQFQSGYPRQEKFKDNKNPHKQPHQQQQESRRDDRHNPQNKDNYRDSRDQQSEYRKDREAEKSQYREKDNRSLREDRREKDDRRDERRDKDDRRDREDRKSRERDDRGRQNSRDRERDRKNDYDKDRKGDHKKHNRSRSRDNKHSRR